MATAHYAHISFDSDRVPILTGTRVKVRLVVSDHVGHGWDAQEIQRQYPHLTLGQIHSALAYYYDHKDEMDADIQQREQRAESLEAEMQQRQGPSPTRADLLNKLGQ